MVCLYIGNHFFTPSLRPPVPVPPFSRAGLPPPVSATTYRMITFSITIALLLCSSYSVVAHPIASQPLEEEGKTLASLGLADWYQPDDHPSLKLFRRQSTAAVGTAAWRAQYPKTRPASNPQQAWLDLLNEAEEAGLIPDIPPSNLGTYPGKLRGSDPAICSSTWKCRGDDDIWDAPDGVVMLSFDDGPVPQSKPLYDYLKQNNQKVTNFMIGQNIRDYYAIFRQAYENNNDIAGHTWSHPYMTGLTNEQIVAELGWTAQIIYDVSDGRVPRYWRPPYGDSDNRVRAIAKHVFGIIQVNWNYDTADWRLGTHGITEAQIHDELQGWIAGPKSPGLNVLEHELYEGSVQAFINYYPSIKENGWVPKSVSEALDIDPYFNAADNKGDVSPWGIVGPDTTAAPSPSSTTSLKTTQTSTNPGNNPVVPSSQQSPTSVSSARPSIQGFSPSYAVLPLGIAFSFLFLLL